MDSVIRRLARKARRTLRSGRPREVSPVLPEEVDPFSVQKSLLAPIIESTIPTILDIGAHRGETVKACRKSFPKARYFCFEAFPESSSLLAQKFANDSLVTVIPKAVSDTPGQKTFFVNHMSATNSLLPRPSSGARYYPERADSKTTMTVDVTTIDEFLESENINIVDVLKLDIQGGELMAFHGATDTLRAGRARLIFTETMFIPHYEGNPLFPDLATYLADFGYTFFDFYRLNRAANGQLRFGDALFINKEVRETVIA